MSEFAPHPSNPLYVADGETYGAPRLTAVEGHWGDPYQDWSGLDNPAERAAQARNELLRQQEVEYQMELGRQAADAPKRKVRTARK